MFKSSDTLTNQSTDQTDQLTNQTISIRILQIISKEPQISQGQIAEKLGKKISTIKYHMGKMKQSGQITRDGNSHKGKWVICKNK